MDLKYLKGVGTKRAEAFEKIGITKLEDFLNFIPRSYLEKVSIKDLYKYKDENALIHGRIIDISYPARRNHPLKIYVNDGSGTIAIPIFGASQYRVKQFILKDKLLLWGKIEDGWHSGKYTLNFNYRDHLKLDENNPQDENFLKYKYIPVYELSGVLKKTFVKPLLLSKIIFNAFSTLIGNNPDYIKESLPEEILDKYDYPSKKEAVLRINFPLKFEDIEKSRKRLAFEELFYLELLMAIKKHNTRNEKKGISFDKDANDLLNRFRDSLGFQFTGAQEKVIDEIYSDMKSTHIMNRLLQGDVGSGKTVVAVYAMLIAIANGYQCGFMCPTELLAEQHYLTISKLAEPLGIKTSLLVGGQKKKLRDEILYGIKSGETNIIIGTHALIQEKVEYNNLGFAVIDEQHKFGVMQRAKLKEKGLNPDILVMTATPIPRTLSITFYGDLDVSIIDELPKGRKEIKTVLRYDNDKPKVFDFIRQEINKGRQVYIVYPIIDESEKLDLKSAEKNYEIIKDKIFPDLNVGMIHGRRFWYEKDEVMQEFNNGKLNILVSTTVIEVGIDIPNATVMMIEDAQRFGLSQLHQLRGRVGRGADQSYCILVAKNLDDISSQRLNIMCSTNDGFKIAEADMKIRGPGEFFGIRQSGVLKFSCTDLIRDRDVLDIAREIAFAIIGDDPHLRKKENALIRENFLKNHKDSLYLMEIA